MNILKELYTIKEKLINEQVESPFGLKTIVIVKPHHDKEKLYITLDNEKIYLFPDSFLENFLKFINPECQQLIESQKEEIKKQQILKEQEIAQAREKERLEHLINEERLRQLQKIQNDRYYKRSANNVAYIYDYYKKDMECSKEERTLCLGILGYKELGQNTWIYDSIINRQEFYDKFTHDLFNLVSKIVYTQFYGKIRITLISVPRSNNQKLNTISKSIKQIVKWANKGYFYNSSVKLIDGSNTLERTTAIEPEKQGSRSIEKHIKSITVKQQFTKNDAIILLDDITTTGYTMNACKKLLIQNGANAQNIVCAALAQTVLDTEKFKQLCERVEELLS